MNTLLLVLALAGPSLDELRETPAAIHRHPRGHLCPTSPTTAYTARHVSTVERGEEETTPPLSWALPSGLGGTVIEVHSDRRRDLAVVDVTPGAEHFPRAWPVALSGPVRGDKVWIVGYDFESDDIRPLVYGTKVTGVLGHLFLTAGSPGPGSSGSCVFRAAGAGWEVLGIHTAQYPRGSRATGVNEGVWGVLGLIPEQWDEHRAPPAEPVEVLVLEAQP